MENEALQGVEAEEVAPRERAWSLHLPAISFYQGLFFAYLTAGLVIFVFLVPPFQKSDESGHFLRTVSLTNGDVVCDSDGAGHYYFAMKRKYAEIEHVFHVFDVATHPNVKFQRSWLEDLDYSHPYNSGTARVTTYCSLPAPGYIPNAVGVLLGKPFPNPLASMYMGRLFGALFFVGCTVLAVRVTPDPYRLIVYFYAALPSVLHQVTAISYDVVQLSLLMPVFAYLVRFLAAEKAVKPWEIALFMAMLLWMISARLLAFAPLLLLFFMVNPAKLSLSVRRYWGVVAGFLLVAGVSTLGLAAMYYPRIKTDADPYSVGDRGQLRAVIENPWDFIEASYKTLRLHGEGVLLKQGTAGFGWQDYGLDWLTTYIILAAGVCIVVLTVQRSTRLLEPYQLGVLAAAIFGTGVGIFLAAYTSWSELGSDQVWGLQGRYFLVLIPLIVLGVAQLAAIMGRQRLVKVLAVIAVMIIVRNIFHAVDVRYNG